MASQTLVNFMCPDDLKERVKKLVNMKDSKYESMKDVWIAGAELILAKNK